MGGVDERRLTGEITEVHETNYQPKSGFWSGEVTGFMVAGAPQTAKAYQL